MSTSVAGTSQQLSPLDRAIDRATGQSTDFQAGIPSFVQDFLPEPPQSPVDAQPPAPPTISASADGADIIGGGMPPSKGGFPPTKGGVTAAWSGWHCTGMTPSQRPGSCEAPYGPIASPAPNDLPPAPSKLPPSTPTRTRKTSPPETTAATRYTVRRGDCLDSIARRHGTTWQKLYAANRTRIDNPNLIYPGQVLVIPARTSSKPQPKSSPKKPPIPTKLPPSKVPGSQQPPSTPPPGFPPSGTDLPPSKLPPTKVPPIKLPPGPDGISPPVIIDDGSGVGLPPTPDLNGTLPPALPG